LGASRVLNPGSFACRPPYHWAADSSYPSSQGHPFMASLRENKPLLYSLLISTTVLFVLASGFLPDLSATFEITPFTEEVKDYSCVTVDRLSLKGHLA